LATRKEAEAEGTKGMKGATHILEGDWGVLLKRGAWGLGRLWVKSPGKGDN
jgi:hypothetical protein